MTNVDLLNLIHATDSTLCVLAVKESLDAEENVFDHIVNDLVYYSNFGNHILNECKYFILLRNIGDKHWGFFFDKQNSNAIFSTKDSDNNLALKVLLRLCSSQDR